MVDKFVNTCNNESPKIEYKNILIIKLSSLGDICHALPSLVALRKLYPDARISWIVNNPFADLLVGHPLLDEVIVIDQKAMTQGSWIERYRYFKKLRKELTSKHFDLVLDLQGLLKSSVIALMTGCTTRYGYWELREGSGLVTKAIKGEHAEDHVIQRYLDVIRYLGSNVTEPEFVLPNIANEELSINSALAEFDNYIVFAPATSWGSKEWPLDNYVELGNKLLASGYQIVLVGGKSDMTKSSYISEQLSKLNQTANIADLTGKTSLKELMAVCKSAVLYISGDTGPLHVAVTTGIPIIAMYGPTMSHRTGPYVSKATDNHISKTIVISGKANCAPCRKRSCELMDCMKSISVDEVWDLVVKQLSSNGQAIGKVMAVSDQE